MRPTARTLKEWVVRLRRDAVEHDGVMICRSVPLFVIAAFFLDDDIMFEAYGEAIADGAGDPEALDPCDNAQTSRLEAAVLARTSGVLAIRELLSIEWWDAEHGPRSASLCVGHTPEDGLLLLQDHDASVSFHAVALGPERALQAVAADRPEIVLPRLAGSGAQLHQVAVRYDVTWEKSDLAAIVHAITGVVPKADHVLRAELLHHD